MSVPTQMSDPTAERLFRDNFKEIVGPLRPEEAVVEANRCLYCYDAPCVTACPTHIDIPRFIRQIGARNLTGSGKTILEANPLGHSCARVCPVEVLCEGACVYHAWQDKPIAIARLQRHATDHIHSRGRQPFRAGPELGKTVAVVGAGPAGLSCAFYLRRLGYAVTVFERSKLPGGLNTYGVAEYKMDMRTSLAEVRQLVSLGADVRMGVEIGKDLAPAKLVSDFDAVFIGVGLGATNSLGVPGEALAGVWDALSFIRWVKARDIKPLGKSRATVVIGGGNTAIDAATQAKRTGAQRVLLAYRRGREAMTAYDFEVRLARSDGAELMFNARPLRILGRKSVEGVEFERTRAAAGALKPVPGSRFVVPCDRVIKAIGQVKLAAFAEALGISTTPEGRILADPGTLETSRPGVFAGGDAVNGGKEVVNAAADGKRAARAIHSRLSPGRGAGDDNEYWVSTIDGRRVAPIPARGEAHG